MNHTQATKRNGQHCAIVLGFGCDDGSVIPANRLVHLAAAIVTLCFLQ
jgi:hypothetical protein